VPRRRAARALWRGAVGDRATVDLGQAGTDVTFTISFRRIRGKWFIVVPLPDELRAKRAEWMAARDPTGKVVNDPYELRSPRDTFRALITGMVQIGEMPDNPAYRALNTSQMSEVVRAQRVPLLALYLKDVIDRAGSAVIGGAKAPPYVSWR
jgi:MscS family membrane protein